MRIIKLELSRQYKPSSQYLGVSWNRQYKKWRASIMVDGRRKILGHCDDEHDAARLYNIAATRHGRNVLNILAMTDKEG